VKRILWLIVPCCLLLIMAACGSKVTSDDPNAIYTSSSDFSKSQITIKQGQTLTFVDNDTLHYLVIGTNALYQKESGAPDLGGPDGHTISAGQVWVTPPWTTPGSYHITCTIHPSMNLTITVTAA
jgi:plastocyanin